MGTWLKDHVVEVLLGVAGLLGTGTVAGYFDGAREMVAAYPAQVAGVALIAFSLGGYVGCAPRWYRLAAEREQAAEAEARSRERARAEARAWVASLAPADKISLADLRDCGHALSAPTPVRDARHFLGDLWRAVEASQARADGPRVVWGVRLNDFGRLACEVGGDLLDEALEVGGDAR